MPIFKLIGAQSDYRLYVFADNVPDLPGIKLGISPGGLVDTFGLCEFTWRKVTNRKWRHACVWQSGVVQLPFTTEIDVYVLWGEAHRISSWVVSVLARLTGRSVIFWTHGMYGNETLVKKLARVIFYTLGDCILYYGNAGKKLSFKAGLTKPGYVIYNSLDNERQNEIIKQLGGMGSLPANSERIRLVYIGRLLAHKKLDMLIRSLAFLRVTYGHDYELILIGDGPERDKLHDLATMLGVIQHVRFSGAVYEETEIAVMMRTVHCCVAPGEVGLTAMHSLAYGVPVVTHDNMCRQMPESEAVIEGVSGALFQEGSGVSLSEAIERCVGYIKTCTITRTSCQNVIREHYTPEKQLKVFRAAIDMCRWWRRDAINVI